MFTAKPCSAALLVLVSTTSALAAGGELCFGPGPDFFTYYGFSSSSEPSCTNVIDMICLDHATDGWTISSSATDPWVLTGPPETTTLYLWFVCSMTGFEDPTTIVFEGTLEVTDFKPLNGFQLVPQLPWSSDLVLTHDGTPYSIVLAGTITVAGPTPVESNSWGRIKGSYR